MINMEKFKVWKDFRNPILNWSARNSPAMFCHESAATTARPARMVLNCVCLVKNHSMPMDTMERPFAFLYFLRPPFYLLFIGYEFDRRIVLWPRLGNFLVSGALERIQYMTSITGDQRLYLIVKTHDNILELQCSLNIVRITICARFVFDNVRKHIGCTVSL